MRKHLDSIHSMESKAQHSYDIKMNSVFVHITPNQERERGGRGERKHTPPKKKKKTFCIPPHMSLRVGTQWLSHFSLWNLCHFSCLLELLSAWDAAPWRSRATRVQSTILTTAILALVISSTCLSQFPMLYCYIKVLTHPSCSSFTCLKPL